MGAPDHGQVCLYLSYLAHFLAIGQAGSYLAVGGGYAGWVDCGRLRELSLYVASYLAHFLAIGQAGSYLAISGYYVGIWIMGGKCGGLVR